MRFTQWVIAGASLAALVGCTKGTILAPNGPGPDGTSVSIPGADGGTGTPGPDGGVAQGPVVPAIGVAQRLSQAELDKTVSDILRGDSNLAVRYLPEDEYAPYDNDYRTQQASEALILAIEVFAQEVSAALLADTARREAVVGCTPTGPDDAACFRQFIQSFGRLALRRPLTTTEVDAYMTLQSFATEANPYVNNDFYTAVDLVIRAILQDPEFLYRIEVGTPTGEPNTFELDNFELASRLSYLIWGTAPDDALLLEAEAGRLSTADGRRAAAQRMLASPKAKDQMHRFHAMWLGYRVIPHPADLAGRFNSETNALLDRVVFDEPQSYLEVFRSTETYLDAQLADHYGLPAPQGGQGWVPYGDSGRAGILSHGAVLASFSKFTDTSPTQRGIFVRTRLMCEKILPPPPNVDVDQPPGGQDATACKVDRYTQHISGTGCNGCHSQMDPIGFGLERFDMGGRYREHDDGRPECPIDGRGTLPNGTSFSGPAELANLLIDAGKIDACVVKQYYAYSIGYEPDSQDLPAVNELTEKFRSQQHGFQDLVLEYVSSDIFARRREGGS